MLSQFASTIKGDHIDVDGLEVSAAVEEADEGGADVLIHLHAVVDDLGVEESEGPDCILLHFDLIAIVGLLDFRV